MFWLPGTDSSLYIAYKWLCFIRNSSQVTPKSICFYYVKISFTRSKYPHNILIYFESKITSAYMLLLMLVVHIPEAANVNLPRLLVLYIHGSFQPHWAATNNANAELNFFGNFYPAVHLRWRVRFRSSQYCIVHKFLQSDANAGFNECDSPGMRFLSFSQGC